MIKTYIILEQLSYEKGNLHQFYRPDQHRFVFMLDQKYYNRFPKEYLNYFDRVEMVSDYNYDNARRLVIDEITRVNSSDEIRLICIDECNLLMVGKLREEFGIPGPTYTDLLPLRDKVKMKERLSRNGILVPRFFQPLKEQSVEQALSYIDKYIFFPIIAKPVDGAGSRNTYEIHNSNEFINFCGNQLNWYDFQFEELIRGVYYHCDSVVIDGAVKVAEVSQYTAPCLDFVKGRMLGSYLLQEGDEIRDRILSFNEQIIQCLCSWDCVTHLEVFYTPRCDIVFIEIAARPAGCSIPLSIQNGVGINLNEIAYKIQFNIPVEVNKKKLSPAAWISFPIKSNGIIRSKIEPSLNSDSTFMWKVGVGEMVSAAATSFEASLEILLVNDDQKSLLEDIEHLNLLDVIEIG